MFRGIKHALTLMGETKTAQRVLTQAFAEAYPGTSANFMNLHPAIHGTLLRQYMMTGDLEFVMGNFDELCETASGNHVRLIDMYRMLREVTEEQFVMWRDQRFS